MRRIEKKMEIMRKGLKRDLEKVKRELHCLPSISAMVLFLVLNFILFLVVSNCVSKKIKKLK